MALCKNFKIEWILKIKLDFKNQVLRLSNERFHSYYDIQIIYQNFIKKN